MIKYEHGMLVLSPSVSKEDAKAIDELISDRVYQERERILSAIDGLEENSHATRTPIYQETMFKKIRKIVLDSKMV